TLRLPCLSRQGHPLRALRVARRHAAAARLRAPAAEPVRARLRRRPSSDVHHGGRTRRARRDRTDGAFPQHAWAAARLRAGLCLGPPPHSRAVPPPDPTPLSPRRRGRDRHCTHCRNTLACAGGHAQARLQRVHLDPRYLGEAVHGTIEPTLDVEWRPLAELASIASEWRGLAGRALAPNVFYEPA